MRKLLFVVLLALGLPRSGSEVPTRRELVRSLRRGGPVVIIFGARDATTGRRLAEEARRVASRRRVPVRLIEASSATREDVSRGTVVLVGTPSSNPWIRKLLHELPLSIGDDGIHLLGKTYSDPGDSLQILYPNPLHVSSPLLLMTGNGDEAVHDAVEHRRRGDLQLRRRGKTVLVGRFRDDWSVDPGLLREFEWPESPALVTDHFRLFSHGPSVGSLEAEGSTLEALRRKVEALFGPLPEARQDVHVYSSLEEKGLVTENTRAAHFDGDDLHVVLGIDDSPERLLAEKLLDVSLGSTTLSRGLAVVLANDDASLHAFDETVRRLRSTSSPPGLSALDGESPYVVRALTASFARYVLRVRGASAFLSSTALDEPLEQRWLRSLDDPKPRASRVPPLPTSFQRGFTFAHEGFDIENGYLSRRSERSLERLKELGIDAVSIVPYAFLTSPSDVSSLSVPDRAGSETDEDVISAIRKAKSLGMTVLLKPQIWLRRSWPGEIEPRTAEGEDRFFQEYGRWMRHYALMAQSEGVELLSIGTELSKLSHGRRARWKTLVGDLRSIYGGRLVYAANWGREVEAVDFWSLLDYIGVDFYYPLSEDETASDEMLRRGFERALEGLRALSLRYEKPVLLTEIGYASTRSPWKQPHASDRGREISLEHQARAYEIAFEALSDETSWIRGMYWWKWPSDLEMGTRSHTGFTPAGKPAEDVVRRWYGGRLQ